MFRLIFLFLIISQSGFTQEINLELGTVENSYNKVRIPGDAGDKFNLAPSFQDQNFFYRLSYAQKFSEKHGFRLLYAPLKLKGDDTFNKNIRFNDATFSANTETDTNYKFNSYRATYFYELIQKSHLLLRIGATLKVRDAEIKLKQGPLSESKKNVGLVPLLYLYSEYKWDNGLRMAFDFDGLIAPQGRAFDIALMAGYYFNPKVHLNLGYRMLDGGADNDTVYNFGFFNFYFTSLNYSF